MAIKKNLRADGTYIISTDSTDNPKLGAKILSDGRESLYLDYYLGFEIATSSKSGKEYKRVNNRREFLKLYLWQAPRTPIERQQNKEILELAKKIRFERGQQLLENAEGYRLKKERKINFLDYFRAYIARYTKKDKRMVEMALRRFVDFLNDTEEYNRYAHGIRPDQITKDMMQDFTDYLQGRSKGEGAKSVYQRFKKVIKHAVEHDVMQKNPCTGVPIKADEQQLRKEILSIDEIEQLSRTHYQHESRDIQRAFLFCCYTGLRFCDVKDLAFSNVDYSNKALRFEQNKTKGHSASSGVVIPLSAYLLGLIGEPGDGGRQGRIFNLPTHEACTKALQRWVNRAGIDKHITWHCARHSFAVNILNGGANIKTVASLLGHSGLKHTEKYTRAFESLKRDAIESLPTPKE